MGVDIDLLVLGALLHDIGKFAQRAGEPGSVDLEGEYCPSAHGRSTHLHVLHTDHFIEKVLPLPPELEGRRSALARLASSHHKPAGDDLLEQCLSRADMLSAGTDRIGEEYDTGDYVNTRLVSVFDLVSLRETKELRSEDFHYHGLGPLDGDFFPGSLEKAKEVGYREHFESFVRDLGGLPLNMGVRHFTASLVTVLEKHTWCIPSSTYKTLPDVSLFDHALSTAAIAQALTVFHHGEATLPGAKGAGVGKFVLLGGDLSGIQEFIFSIDKSHGSGVAKLFRARSMYLQAITRSVVLVLLERLGLSPVAKVMDAGGRFTLILPADDRTRETLPGFMREVQRWFLENFRGGLYLSMDASVVLSEKDLSLEDFPGRLGLLNDRLEEKKLMKFDLLMEEEGFSPVLGHGFDHREDGNCRVCRANAADGPSSEEYGRVYGRDVVMCRACFDQIKHVGARLPEKSNKYFLYSREGEGVPLFGGLKGYFKKSMGSTDITALDIANLRSRDCFSFHPAAGHMPVFTTEDVARLTGPGGAAAGIRGGPITGEAVREGMAKTFNDLARESRRFPAAPGGRPRGAALLGVLKADVDNLGFLFSFGLAGRLSIARFAGMSRMLNHFFSSYMVKVIEESYRDVYVVFSGGDDLLLLGPWSTVVDFAADIRERFRSFCGGNPEVTLSAGIAVSKPKLPVQRLAREAESLLERSKARGAPGGHGGGVKDAVTLFDTTVGWGEFATLLAFGRWLEEMVDGGKMTLGLARRLLGYSEDYRAFTGGGEIAKGIYLSHMSYDFARNLDEKNMTREESARVRSVPQDGFLLCCMRLPVSWVLYRLRSE